MKKIPRFYEKKGPGEPPKWVAYYHAVRKGGKLVWTALGKDRAAALREWARIEGLATPAAATETLAQVTAAYLAWAEKEVSGGRLAARTLLDYTNYSKAILPVFGAASLDAIEPVHVRKYIDARSSNSMGKREMRLVSTIFNWARERGMTSNANPVSGVRMPSDKGRTIVVGLGDYSLMYEFCSELMRDTMSLTVMLGARPNEALNARFEDVNGDSIQIWQNKVGKWKTVKFSPDLADLIARRRELAERMDPRPAFVLFNGLGQHFHLKNAAQYEFRMTRAKVVKFAKKGGIKFTPFQLRDLRPMAGVATLQALGMDAARRLLGHTTEEMTSHYTTKRLGQESAAADITQRKALTDDR